MPRLVVVVVVVVIFSRHYSYFYDVVIVIVIVAPSNSSNVAKAEAVQVPRLRRNNLGTSLEHIRSCDGEVVRHASEIQEVDTRAGPGMILLYTHIISSCICR